MPDAQAIAFHHQHTLVKARLFSHVAKMLELIRDSSNCNGSAHVRGIMQGGTEEGSVFQKLQISFDCLVDDMILGYIWQR